MTYVIGTLASEPHIRRLLHWVQIAAAAAAFGFLVLLVLGVF